MGLFEDPGEREGTVASGVRGTTSFFVGVDSDGESGSVGASEATLAPSSSSPSPPTTSASPETLFCSSSSSGGRRSEG